MKKIDWKDLWISMAIYLVFFIGITVGMLVTNTWEVDGRPLKMFLGLGFPISVIVIIVKQNLLEKK